MTRLTTEWRAALLALLIATLVHGLMLAKAGGDTFVFAALGEDDTVTTEHIRDVVGDDDLLTRSSLGHDGKFFLLQAWDPLYLTEDHADQLDRPVYRGQRMLFPLVAGLGGLAPVAAVPALMALTNIFALAVGTLGTARLAQHYGKNPMYGLAFLFNLGVLSEISIGGAGILAFALAVWGSLALEEERYRDAAILFALSALTREVMLLYVAGAALLLLVRSRRLPWLVAAPAGIAVALWGLYLRLRLDSGTGIDEVRELGLPLVGMAEAAAEWPGQGPVTVGFMLAILATLPWLVRRAVVDPNFLTWAATGFVLLASLLTVFVWREPFDISRGIIPVFTALAVSVAPLDRPRFATTTTVADSGRTTHLSSSGAGADR